MIIRYLSIFILSCSLLLIQGCIKEDLSKISDEYEWRANLSLPGGSVNMDSESFGGEVSIVDTYKILGVITHEEEVGFNMLEIINRSEYVDNLMLRLDIHNNFPAKLEIFILYVDKFERIAGNMIAEKSLKIDKPTIDEDGDFSLVHFPPYDVELSKEEIESMADIRKVLVRVNVTDIDLSDEVIDQLDKFSIDVNIGIRSIVDIPVDKF